MSKKKKEANNKNIDKIAKAAIRYSANKQGDVSSLLEGFAQGARWMQNSLNQAYQICYQPKNGGTFLSPELYADPEYAAGLAPKFMTDIIRHQKVIATDEDKLAVMPIKINH